MKTTLLTILIPVYNEENCIFPLYKRLATVAEKITPSVEFLFVNDGSADASLSIIKGLQEIDTRVSFVDLSRNFGKEKAMCAGIDYVQGDALGEYGSVDDFFVNNNGIFVYDGIKHKLFNYLINGDYINSINVNVKAQHVIEYNNTYVFYGSNLEMDDSQVNVCDKNGYIINSLLIKDDCSLIDLPLYRPLSIVNDQLYLTTTFDYNIYTCSKENIEVKWKLDFANNSLNSSFKNENKKNLHIADVITSKSFRDKVLWVDAISGVDDWFLFTAVTGGGDHHLIFNEQNDIIYSLDQIGHPFDFFDSQLFLYYSF